MLYKQIVKRSVSKKDQCISRQKNRKSILYDLEVGDSASDRRCTHFHPAVARDSWKDFLLRKMNLA